MGPEDVVRDETTLDLGSDSKHRQGKIKEYFAKTNFVARNMVEQKEGGHMANGGAKKALRDLKSNSRTLKSNLSRVLKKKNIVISRKNKGQNPKPRKSKFTGIGPGNDSSQRGIQEFFANVSIGTGRNPKGIPKLYLNHKSDSLFVNFSPNLTKDSCDQGIIHNKYRN